MDKPAGHLGTFLRVAPPGLSDMPTEALAAELLARLRRGESLAGHRGFSELFAVLAMELEVHGDLDTNRFSRRHLATTLAFLHDGLPEGLPWLAGRTVVEVGCGSINPLGRLLALVLTGCARGIGIDLDEVQDLPAACRGLVRCALYLLGDPRLVLGAVPAQRADVAARLSGFDLVRLWQGDPGGVDTTRLVLRRESADGTSLQGGEADLVFSTSFLEHVADAAAVAVELARITRPGGFGLHTIDGLDHWGYCDVGGHPLAFLKEAPGVAMVHECNRLRPLQFPEIFARSGFEVLRFDAKERVAVDESLRASLVETFRSLPQEVLEVPTAALVLRRR